MSRLVVGAVVAVVVAVAAIVLVIVVAVVVVVVIVVFVVWPCIEWKGARVEGPCIFSDATKQL